MLRPLFALLAAFLAGCATAPPPRGVDYPAPAAAAPAAVTPPPISRPAPPAPAAGSGLDAVFERSALLADSFYKNADALLQQVEPSGAMGVNRGWEAGTRKGGEWFIEEQRFADSIIGAGVNRNRMDLISAGLRAIEWGFAQQAMDGSFPCRDNYLGTSYFVAATAHSLWLLESTGYGRSFSGRIGALRSPLERAARWLADSRNAQVAAEAQAAHASRLLLTGYALSAAGHVLGVAEFTQAGDASVTQALQRQHTSGYFYERGGFDASYHAEGLVYLLRYYDHAAGADSQRHAAPALQRGLDWLATRVNARGVVQVAGNTRTGANQERDRTGAPRRISAVAIARAFGLAGHVLAAPRYEPLARAVISARQAG
ncbi:MAG: hypothetical protein JNL19_15935 [Burkholderiales bacterium]|nr:hypothetical protein [Burkholderiales bacterium]